MQRYVSPLHATAATFPVHGKGRHCPTRPSEYPSPLGCNSHTRTAQRPRLGKEGRCDTAAQHGASAYTDTFL